MNQSTMHLWNSVCDVPSEFLKPLPGKAGLTSIDAYYQIRRATEVFGPIGKGWGFTAELQMISDPEPAVIAHLTIWHSGDLTMRFNAVGCCPWMFGRNNPMFDSDAPKKAITDALTKGLSMLGFGATIFLGGHSSKYSEEPQAQAPANLNYQPPQATPAPAAELAKLNDLIPFGKHKGTAWRHVPRGYLQWLLSQPVNEQYIERDREQRTLIAAALALPETEPKPEPTEPQPEPTDDFFEALGSPEEVPF